MKDPMDVGLNRTGIAVSPVQSKQMIDGAEKLTPKGPPPSKDGEAIRMRIQEAREAPPIGTVPPPGSLKQVATTAKQMLKGNKATVLVDKLAERLAFERTGVRLYDMVLVKLAAKGSWEGGPTHEELKAIRDDELEHFLMLKETIEELGADPTAMTPSADVIALASEGVVKVANDPRMTVSQTLEAILTAELVDNEGWDMLIALADTVGQTRYVERFRAAREAEARHLDNVRRWLNVHIEGEATRSVEPTQPSA